MNAFPSPTPPQGPKGELQMQFPETMVITEVSARAFQLIKFSRRPPSRLARGDFCG